MLVGELLERPRAGPRRPPDRRRRRLLLRRCARRRTPARARPHGGRARRRARRVRRRRAPGDRDLQRLPGIGPLRLLPGAGRRRARPQRSPAASTADGCACSAVRAVHLDGGARRRDRMPDRPRRRPFHLRRRHAVGPRRRRPGRSDLHREQPQRLAWRHRRHLRSEPAWCSASCRIPRTTSSPASIPGAVAWGAAGLGLRLFEEGVRYAKEL